MVNSPSLYNNCLVKLTGSEREGRGDGQTDRQTCKEEGQDTSWKRSTRRWKAVREGNEE